MTPAAPPSEARRRFLVAGLAAPAAAVGALLGAAVPGAPAAAVPAAVPEPRGYHVTGHVLACYRSMGY